MTNREFYTAIAGLTNIDSELVDKATDLLEKMDASLEKRKGQPRKVSEETIAKREAIFGALTLEAQTADAIAALTGYSKNCVAGVLRQYIADGAVVKSEVDAPNAEGKMRKVKAYALNASPIGVAE